MLAVYPVTALQDNYIWCVVHQKNVVVVDPGDASPVIHFLKEKSLLLSAILLTHHHNDHTQGVSALLNYRTVPVYGPSRIPQVTNPLNGDTVHLEAIGSTFSVIKVPGHTLEHVAYYSPKIVFTGDTLFTGGCGKIFEGTPKQMYESLCKLLTLPNDTLIYCGHEYTESNLQFAIKVEPNNQNIQSRIELVKQLRSKNIPTVPATLELEKKTNPFLRCEEPEVIAALLKERNITVNNPIDTLKALREWKNDF